MAENTFTFRLVTPQRLLSEGPVLYLQVPGSEGYLGVLAHHAPLITALRPGELQVKDPSGKISVYAVSGGFFEVSGNRATLLADAAEMVEEIDRDRARDSFRRAEARLQSTSGHHVVNGATVAEVVDRERARRSLERAKNRLEISSQ
jgi:F-type H+-transporting ATPase subunit epsilon